jgi:hypothetical protein
MHVFSDGYVDGVPWSSRLRPHLATSHRGIIHRPRCFGSCRASVGYMELHVRLLETVQIRELQEALLPGSELFQLSITKKRSHCLRVAACMPGMTGQLEGQPRQIPNKAQASCTVLVIPGCPLFSDHSSVALPAPPSLHFQFYLRVLVFRGQ